MALLQQSRTAENVVVGFTLGDAKPVALDLRRSGASKNTLIVGTSGSGKSVLGRMAITQGARLGFKVIILELKDEPDYGPWYPNIKPYITRSSDPDILGELLDLGTDKISLILSQCFTTNAFPFSTMPSVHPPKVLLLGRDIHIVEPEC